MDLTKAKLWFVTLSCATFVLFVISALQEEDREWKKWQKAYFAMEQERGIDRDYSVKIRQYWNPKADRTDRCITCHVGMEDPDVAVPYKQNPFKSHPKVAMMKNHNTNKMGCTVCHEGQGLATSTEAAHGWVHAWDYPMHKKRGGVDFIQASCTKCHAPDKLPEGTELLVSGRALFDKYGCIGCHKVQGVANDGGVQGPELTGMGSQSESLFSNKHNFDHVTPVTHYEFTTKYQWLYQHFLDPLGVTPDNPHTPDFDGTVMPNFQMSETEAKVLTLFVQSFRDEAADNIPVQWLAKGPGKYSVVKAVPTAKK